MLCVEPWLNTQWQTKKYHILLADDGHIFLTCPQLVGTWVQNMFRNLVSFFMGDIYFQEFGPKILTCLQLVGTWVKHIFRNLVPHVWRVMLFLACHVLNDACHGVSISIVSISSVSCRVRILRVSVSMPCRGHLDLHLVFVPLLACRGRIHPNLPVGVLAAMRFSYILLPNYQRGFS